MKITPEEVAMFKAAWEEVKQSTPETCRVIAATRNGDGQFPAYILWDVYNALCHDMSYDDTHPTFKHRNRRCVHRPEFMKSFRYKYKDAHIHTMMKEVMK